MLCLINLQIKCIQSMMKILSPVFKKEHPRPLALQQGRQCSLNDSCHETLYQIPKILF